MLQSPQRRTTRSGLPRFVLLSVVGLLALAAFAPSAMAEIEYKDAPSELPQKGSEIPTDNGTGDNPGTAKQSGGGPETGETELEGETEGEGEDESAQTGGTGPGKDSGDGGGKSEGNGSKSGGIGDNTVVTQSETKPVADAGDSADDSGGGSSALVPILIALAAIAAISIGAIVYRQKRPSGDPDSPASPKAS